MNDGRKVWRRSYLVMAVFLYQRRRLVWSASMDVDEKMAHGIGMVRVGMARLSGVSGF